MRVLLCGPDDIIPNGSMLVNLYTVPRTGELMVWRRHAAPPEYFRVDEVCHVFSGPMDERVPPQVRLEPVEGP
jgi:hypothetical protein